MLSHKTIRIIQKQKLKNKKHQINTNKNNPIKTIKTKQSTNRVILFRVGSWALMGRSRSTKFGMLGIAAANFSAPASPILFFWSLRLRLHDPSVGSIVKQKNLRAQPGQQRLPTHAFWEDGGNYNQIHGNLH